MSRWYYVWIILSLLPLSVATSDAGEPVSAKSPSFVTAPPIDPALIRQGGDTIADAFEIGLPYAGSGTTAGYSDDYDEVCPYSGSTSPDVVYTFVHPQDEIFSFDLFGSSYDTKIYLYDIDQNLVACNDDFHPDYTSCLEMVPIEGGMTYYLVIDGYGGSSGDYTLSVLDSWSCVLPIPAGAIPEGEPPLVTGYVDTYNSGCDSSVPGVTPFQELPDGLLHGLAGAWLNDSGTYDYDIDWYTVTLGASGVVEIEMTPEVMLEMSHWAPTDCSVAEAMQYDGSCHCYAVTMTIVGEPGEVVWIRLVSMSGGDTGNEFDYLLSATYMPVAVEARSLSTVKGLFR